MPGHLADGRTFDDTDAFFEEADGQLAISATSIKVLEQQSDE